jgi:isopenicillin-N epimerase
MSLDRKALLVRTGLALAAAGLGEELWPSASAPAELPDALELRTWAQVRAQFRLTTGLVHFGSFLLASHPAPVRGAIAAHRRGLDADPVEYLHGNWAALDAAVLREAGQYLGGSPVDIALTDSTTMGLGLLYNGIDLRAGQEALTTQHDFMATHESLRLKAARTGATVRKVALYDRSETASEDQIVERLIGAVGPRTRIVAVTWVHSSTGVKLPIRRIADALASVNAGRSDTERALLCVDGVHGLGVEDATVEGLGCDFLVAGCHKWLFGPRGTGLVWGRPQAWPAASPTIPSFTDTGTPGSAMTPGGFHSFEHRWALAQAFAFHRRIGKRRVAARIHQLSRQVKAGLASMSHVTLYTPRADALSAGLVCFDVARLSPGAVVQALRARGIVATETPYTPSYARVGPGLLNTPRQVETLLNAIRALR